MIRSLAMPWLFSYGTLQMADVQWSTFGRRLEGRPDGLRGFEPSSVPIENPSTLATSGRTHHANARFTGRSESQVSGTVFDVSDTELASADEFERGERYVRIAVVLVSGIRAWVYVDARTAPDTASADWRQTDDRRAHSSAGS